MILDLNPNICIIKKNIIFNTAEPSLYLFNTAEPSLYFFL